MSEISEKVKAIIVEKLSVDEADVRTKQASQVTSVQTLSTL